MAFQLLFLVFLLVAQVRGFKFPATIGSTHPTHSNNRIRVDSKYQLKMSQLDPKLQSSKTILGVVKALGSGITVGSFLKLAVGLYGSIKELLGDLSWRYKRLATSHINLKPYFIDHVGPDSDYISRSKMEKLILSVYDNTDNRSGQYFVMYGPKGAGKSSLVAKVLAEKCGVTEICISQGDTVDTTIQGILKSCQL